MSSYFVEIDDQTNPSPSFWSPPESLMIEDITQNQLLSGELRLLKTNNQSKVRTFILTTSSLYSCKKGTNNPKKMAIIKWKRVEAFMEEGAAEQRYGFKLGHKSKFFNFYAENSKILETWLISLSSVAIMTDLEDDYILINELGKKNYSTAYLAHDLQTSEKFAIKQINKEAVNKSSRGVSGVIREIEIMRKISHPYCVKLYRVYESENHISLIIEYVECGSLFDRILTKVKFTEEVSAKLAKNMFEVIRYLHSLNFVHRDLKPENFLMTSYENDYEFKICDFGLACIAGNDLFPRCGSPGYVAPELLSRKAYNNKVDVFGAGIILFIILSGRAPFCGSGPSEILNRNKECRIIFYDRYWAHISSECKDFVMKLTELDPDVRLSADQALRDPWLEDLYRRMECLLPSKTRDEDKSPDAGASVAIFNSPADKRQVEADAVLGSRVDCL